jgi:hypothetical protein
MTPRTPNDATTPENLRGLAEFAEGLPPGPVGDRHALSHVLSATWHDLVGDVGGMEAGKLTTERIESPIWNPPQLHFAIERHGGTVAGSTRAEVQHWSVNVETGEASLDRVTQRQLSPTDKRLDVKALARDVADLIMSGTDDERLAWSDGKQRVTVVMSKTVPETHKQTTTARRKRFRAALEPMLAEAAWNRAPDWSYVHDDAGIPARGCS